MPILQSNSPYIDKWRSTTVLLTAVTVLVALGGVFTPHSPVAAQGIAPTATATPTATSPPNPTPVPTARSDGANNEAQPGGLFHELDGNPPPSIGVDTLANRLVGIDFGQLSQVVDAPVSPKDPVTGKPTKPHTLALNLFDDVVFTGIVEHIEPTSSGHALWGGLEGMELGTMTLVVNGSVVVGTVRTPDAVYTIRTVAGGAYVVRQIDESSLLPLGEPLNGQSPAPDTRPPSPSQEQSPTEPVPPDGISTSTPTPVSTVPKAPSERAPEEAPAGGLFSEAEGGATPSTGVETLDSRLVGIDFGQLAQVTNPSISSKDSATETSPTPQTLVLNLFDDVVFTGIVEHVEPTSSGHALQGRLDGVGLGTFTLVVNGRVVIGTVRTPDAVYTIRTAGDGTYVIHQIDESSLPPLGEPLEGPSSTPEARSESDDVPPDDGSVIDVMVVYTPLAKHLEGGRAAIEALIDLFVAETNQAYANSGVIHRINLMLREEVDYTEDGGSSIDLSRLSNGSDGHMDHVHERRDMYGADLVHILVGRSDVGGRALFIALESSTDGEALGFGLTVSWCGGLCFAHELGHNMGLLHDRYQIGVPRTGSHYGYVNQRMFEPGAPESARWRTIMSYPTQCAEVADFYCEQIGYFSNPENNYNGDPMGVPADHPSTGVDGPANAVGTLNDRREITANFRQSSASPSPRVHLTLSPYWLSENGGVSKVTATLHRPSSADTTVTVSASPSDAVTLSGSRTLTIPAGRTVSVASVTITGVDNGDQTGDLSVTVSATAANTSSLGVVDPEPVALVIADDETTPVVTLSLSPSEIAEHEGWTFVTAMLDNRSSADTIVSVSAEPAELIEQRWDNTLTIPAGQTESIGFGVSLLAVDNDELAEATQTVTVSGTSENPHGVAGPENVTLTIIDDEAPFFADDSIAYTFTAGIAVSRFLPEAEFGNGKLTYSLSPAPSNDVTFTPEPPARIGVSATSVAAGETSYTLTATDADGDTDTMTISITVRKGVCPNSAAVSGYSDPGIVHDCEALLASRDTLSVDQSLNWDEDLPIDEWKGVELADGRVVELRMSSEGIVGTIPSELGNLANLQGLSLWGNRLTGGIPKELGNLANLRSLWLSGNQLTGGIPEELGSLSNLQTLDLYGNQLTGVIPKELGNLSNLRSLYLGGNQLTGGIPKELGNLSNLWLLFLYDNQLTGEIPKELGNLANLQALYLQGNQLTGEIPEELGSLAVLRGLNLYGNQLTGVIPKELGNLANLRALRLHGNQLTGEIPPELGRLANLVWLYLHDNQLTGEIPPELGGLSNLERLYLQGNQLTGVIPKELGNLSNLQKLYLGGNLLTGCVPDGLRDVPDNDLNQLGLTFCSVSSLEAPVIGTVTRGMDLLVISWSAPASDGGSEITAYDLRYIETAADETVDSNWTVVEDIWTTGSGDLQYTLTGLTADTQYDIQVRAVNAVGDGPWSATVTGTPTTVSACASGSAVPDPSNNPGLVSDCEALLASEDVLAVSASLNWSADTPMAQWEGITLRGTTPRVGWLDLRDQGLGGSLPAALGRLSNLTYLNLRRNDLSGSIPTELGYLTNLRVLNLHSNELSGTIPDLSSMTKLGQLYLANNDLDGSLPAWLGNMTNMRELWLWGNRLSGPIPDLSGMTALVRLKLQTNEFTEGIPASFGKMTDLVYLYLHDNSLTGNIPSELGDMSSLRYLWLHTNELEGGIPPELGKLTSLWDLNLHSNGLTGSIPGELGDLSSLTHLRLHRNELSGPIPGEFGNLSSLKFMWLHGNQLTGEMPVELGNLAKLQRLYLSENQLTGDIPAELDNLADTLTHWRLAGNRFTGCVPAGLVDVPDNDLGQLGLEPCAVP